MVLTPRCSKEESFVLSSQLSDNALQILLKHGLGDTRGHDLVAELRAQTHNARIASMESISTGELAVQESISENHAGLIRALTREFKESAARKYWYIRSA